MTTEELRHHCAREGIRLSVEAGQLKVKAPVGAVTAAIRAALTQHRDALIRQLENPSAEMAPLSSSQRSLWLLHEADPGSLPAYTIRAARRLRGPLDVERLEAALRLVVARHDPLRAEFHQRLGELWQDVQPTVTVQIARHDVAALSAEQREAAWQTLLADEGRRRFDLARAPLFTVAVVRLSPLEHVLLLNAHHLIADAWSAGLLLREWAERYAGLGGGRQGIRSELPVYRFADYVHQRRRAEGSAKAAAALDYWRKRLAQVPPLQWPTEVGWTAGRAEVYDGRSIGFEIDVATASAVRALARAEGATVFHVLIAAYAVFLQRISGQDDFGIGTTLAGRDGQVTESLVGYFVNLVVLRPDLRGQPSFRELVRRMRGETLAAFDHQETPFDRIVQELRLGRETGVSPLFQTLFLYLQSARDEASFPGLVAESIMVPSMSAKYALSLQVEDHGDTMAGLIEYRTQLLAPAMVARMVEVWRTLVGELAGAPDRAVAAAAVLSPAAAREVLGRFNGEPAEVGTAGGVAAAFRAQVARTPGAIALVDEDREFTYGALDAASEQVARRLRAAGVGPERRVAVGLERGVEMLATLLGILKAGGAYVPMDPTYPEERLRHMLEDAAPTFVVTRRALDALWPGRGVPRLFIEDVPLHEPIDAAVVGAWPEQPAYVIYTSGSTGRPKGVVVNHGNVINFFAGMDRQLGSQPGVWLALTSISFDISVLELFWTLARGFKVVLQGDEVDLGVTETRAARGARRPLAEQFQRHRPTHFQATPSRLKMLLLDPVVRGGMEQLQVLIAGGEALPSPLARELLTCFGGRLHNLYGPTETTVWSTGRELARTDDVILIGRPLLNQQAYVLGPNLEPVPVGVVGELFLGGAGVTRGYLGRPELTAERFLPDPFGGRPGGRLYRTGDRARWRADGVLECLGRVDHQVKIRGHRIEPGEIEAELARHPGVRTAAVTTPLGPDGEPRLVAYYVARAGGEDGQALADGLRRWLRDRLPAYMVPAVYVAVAEMPQTPNGKIDRRALPSVDAAVQPVALQVLPRNYTEARVAAVWCDLLRRAQVGVDENFFEIGGHSLMAMQLVARLRGELGAELSLRVVFESPTVAGLAGRIAGVGGPRDLPVLPVRTPGPVPLSLGQRRIWFVEQLEPGRATYNMPAVLRWRGDLDLGALGRAWSALISRHEALRTRFPAPAGEPVVEVVAPAEWVLPLEDFTGHAPEDRDEAAGRRAQVLAVEPFDLAQGPLVRGRVLRLDPRDHRVVFVLHHIVADGWTINLLTRELGEAYAAAISGRTAAWLPLRRTYADFAAWQQERVKTASVAEDLAFWKTYLSDAPAGVLPVDRPRPRRLNGVGAELRGRWEPALLEGLREVARQNGATLFMVLHALLHTILARSTRQSDLVIGTSAANRPWPEVDGVAGFFVNLLPLRLDGALTLTFPELLRAAKESALAALAHEGTPFEVLVERLTPDRDPSRTPFFQTVLVLLNAPSGRWELPGAALEVAPLANGTSKFDLTLLAEESADGLRWTAEYRTELYDESTVARALEHLRILAQAVVQAQDRPLVELEWFSAAERAALVVTRNTPVVAFDAEHGLGTWFSRTAQRWPDRVAVSGPGGSLSYAELQRQARHLARRLRARGVTRGSRVGLGMARTTRLPVAILGILLAGAAYVPLDPAYPVDRLAYMATDAGLRWAIVDHDFPSAVWSGVVGGVALIAADFAVDEGHADEAMVEAGVGAGDAAYVIYTSGSTGRPKGCVVTHGNVVRLMRGTECWYEFGVEDVWTLFHSYAFDFSVWELWGALLYGGRLVVVSYEESRSPEGMHALLVREGVTVLNQTPSAFRQLQAVDEGRAGVELALRYVIFGGEALEPRTLLPWFERRGDERPAMVNMYGITETTVHVTYRRIRRADAQSGRGSVIGERIPDLTLYVVDERLEPVPVGVPGELLVGGAGLARGYLGRPELTAERFVANPFGAGRLYRSGDLARWLADGDLEYLGRIDQQVKIRGFRIELGEIESVVGSHAAVQDVAVIVREDRPGDQRLVAYVVARDAGDASCVPALRSLCQQRLPDYMRPAFYVVIPRLPLTSNGKLDRRVLPPPAADDGVGKIAPRTATERIVAEVWAEVLGGVVVGVRDNFFELGGHSLLATQVFARLRERAGAAPALQVLFEEPTVERIASELDAVLRGEAGPRESGPELRKVARSRRKISVNQAGEIERD